MSTWPAVSLQPSRVALGPGEGATVEVDVTNTGDVVEHYAVQVLGLPPGQLAEVQPPVTKLQPGESGRVSVRLELSAPAPPAAATLVLGVLVRSPYRPEVSRAEELRLEVLPVPGLSVRAEPEVASGSRGDYRIVLRNDGNTGLDVVLKGSDPESSVRLTFTPQRSYLSPGAEGGSDLIAKANRPLTGRDVQRRIAVVAQAGSQVATVDLTLTQRPRIAGALLRVTAGVGGLLVAVCTILGATVLVTKAIAGAGKNAGNAAQVNAGTAATGQVQPVASAVAKPTASAAITATGATTPSATSGYGGTPVASGAVTAGAIGNGAAAGPIDLDLTMPPADGRPGWHVIDSDAYPKVLLAAQPPKQANPDCADETRVQFVTAGASAGFVSSGSVSGTAGAQTGHCMDMPVLIRFSYPVRSVTVTVLPTLAGGLTATSATYGIAGPNSATPTKVTGNLGRPIQLTWSDPAGINQVKVGGYPGYQGTITAIQHIAAG